MEQHLNVYRGRECVMRGASLQQAAELLNIDILDLAQTLLMYGRCYVGELSAVPTENHQTDRAFGECDVQEGESGNPGGRPPEVKS